MAGGKPISVRISANDWVGAEGIEPQDAVEIARLLQEAGVDICDVSAGQTSIRARPVYGRMFQTPFSDRIRNETGMATMAVGNIYEPDHVNSILMAGRADLVCLARPHLADPYWTLHAAARLGDRGEAWPPPYYAGRDQLYRLSARRPSRRRARSDHAKRLPADMRWSPAAAPGSAPPLHRAGAGRRDGHDLWPAQLPLQASAARHDNIRMQVRRCHRRRLDCASFIERAQAARGRFDIVVANAGMAESAPAQKISLALWNRTIAVNLTGAFLSVKPALAAMRERGWGRIVFIASTAGLKGYAYVAPYVAAKHGVVGLPRALAIETATAGITVNAICPGFTETTMLEQAVDRIVAASKRSEGETRTTLEANNPQGRFIKPEEVADAVLWLCAGGERGDHRPGDFGLGRRNMVSASAVATTATNGEHRAQGAAAAVDPALRATPLYRGRDARAAEAAVQCRPCRVST